MTKGINLDIIGAVQLEQYQHKLLFNKKEPNSPLKNPETEDQSPVEQKAKLIEYLNAQRKPLIEQSLDDSEIYKLNSTQISVERYQNGSKMNGQPFKRPPPYGVLTNGEKSLNQSISQFSILPPVKRSNYYLAHSLDLSQPDYVSIKLSNKNEVEDVYYDNKKDSKKVNNRSISPDEIREATIQYKGSYQQIPKVIKRNMELSKESPFNFGAGNYARFSEKDIDAAQISVNATDKDQSHIQNSRRASIGVDNNQSQLLLPMIKSSSTLQLMNQGVKRDHLMADVLQPLKKQQQQNSSKLEKEIQQQVNLSKMLNGQKGLNVKTKQTMEGIEVQQQPQSNVLFEPEIYQVQHQAVDEQMVETQSVSTIVEGNASIVTNYRSDLDPSIFQAQKIRCCMCGLMMTPNESNTCISCLKSQIDITEGITKNMPLYHCRECNRYLRPPWTSCALESPELLALLLKQLKGLKRVKLIDAGFVWTEPHSRRIKVKLTVQKEVMNGTLLQQSFVIDFIVTNQQCDDCKKTYTPHIWISQVQVRQRVEHKRTFLFLEQMIIKNNAADKCIGIREMHDGLDFQFKNKSHGNRLLDFISNKFMSKFKTSKQLISHDERCNTYHYKYTISLDIAPICKDDLVVLPKQLSKELGGLGPMVLVYKVTTFVHIVDVFTMRTYEVDSHTYWKYIFTALCGRDRLTEFIVLNIENADTDVNVSRAAAKQKFKMVQVEIARVSDFGHNDRTYIVNTHLGEVLNFNDTVLGFDLDGMNLMQLEELDNNSERVPPVVLVKKTYPKFRKRQKHRIWKLKHLDKEAIDENNIHKKDKNQGRYEKDYKMFIQDIEEDPDIRNNVELYRNDDVIAQLEKKLAGMNIEEGKSKTQKELDKGTTKIGNKERKLAKATRKTDEGKRQHDESEEQRKREDKIIKATLKQKDEVSDEEGWESVEEDYPHIKIDELKTLEQQLAGMQIKNGESDEDDDKDDDIEGNQEESKVNTKKEWKQPKKQ